MRNAEGENGTLLSKRDEGILINVKNNFHSSEIIQTLQVYKLSSSTSAFALVDIVRLEGLNFYFGDDDFGLRPRRHS